MKVIKLNLFQNYKDFENKVERVQHIFASCEASDCVEQSSTDIQLLRVGHCTEQFPLAFKFQDIVGEFNRG